LITTRREKYILRVYRTAWRTDSDVLYEVDVLNHLERKGVSVAVPIAQNDGSYLQRVEAPEGPRQIVLFTYANGDDVWNRDECIAPYGRSAAEIHNATEDFSSPHVRFPLDVGELLDKPLTAIQPRLLHRPDDWSYLQHVAHELRDRIDGFAGAELEKGFCHGDLHGGNAHVADGKLTFFDFDCCGLGWRAYDLAVFLWSVHLNVPKKARQRWEGYLRGYREARALGEADLAAIPHFVAIRHIWLMGLHAGNGQDWGYGWMGEDYYNRALKFLRTWEKDRLRDLANVY
jgi:Ser/Thr protein kinase RdoA (MazF antagonist)